jgi:pimeloyl-ACP methyl ester carboxylesterase
VVLQRLSDRQICKQHSQTFTGQSFRLQPEAALGIAGVSGHAHRNGGLCGHQQTAECGGNARHGSVPDVERLPLVTAPMMRSSIGDERSFRWGSGTAFSKGVPDKRSPDDCRRPVYDKKERTLKRSRYNHRYDETIPHLKESERNMDLEVIVREPEFDLKPTPILFVHGMWHGAWCWDEHFLPYFAQKGYRCSALSLRGHAGSEGRERLRWTSLADYAADVAQVVSRMDAPPVLVGHSMGGAVVQKYLESHETPAAVLLASIPTAGVFGATLRVLRRRPLAFLKANLTLSMYPIVCTPSLAHEAFFSADILPEKLEKYFGLLQDDSYRVYLDAMIFNLPRPKKINTPIFVLGAAEDAIFSTGEIEATARAYDTQAEIFPNMAHDMMLEDGWQDVADRILARLSEKNL